MLFESELTKLLPLTSLDLGTFSTDFGRRIFIRLSAGRGGMAACGDLALALTQGLPYFCTWVKCINTLVEGSLIKKVNRQCSEVQSLP